MCRHRPTNRVQLTEPPFSTTSIRIVSGWISIPIGRIDLDLDSFSLKEFRGARSVDEISSVEKRTISGILAISTRNFDVTSAVGIGDGATALSFPREFSRFWKLLENTGRGWNNETVESQFFESSGNCYLCLRKVYTLLEGISRVTELFNLLNP